MSSVPKFQGTPAQAWQAALGQLQLEMDKLTFEKWVRDSFFISYTKDIFSIGAADKTTRDWLEDRLTGLSRKILTGIICESANIEFIVAPRPETADPSSEEDGVPVEASLEDEEREIDAVPFWYSRQESEVRPTIGTFLPGYFVHYLPLLSHAQTLVYMGLYRTALVRFLSTSATRSARPPAAVIRVSNSIISQRSGLSSRTVPSILRQAVEGTWFGSLVRRLNPQDTRAPKGEHSRKMPQIQVAMDLPLLPHHADRISKNLRSVLKAGAPADEAIRSLMASPWDVFLPFDPSIAESARPPEVPLTFDKIIVKELERAGRSYSDQDETLVEAVANVRAYIARSNHTIGLSDYLIQKWRPYISLNSNGHSGMPWPLGAFLLISYFRYLGYISFSRTGLETQDFRDEIEIPGGYKELADRLGVLAPASVHRWLKSDWTSHFVRAVDGVGKDMQDMGWVEMPRRFRVAMIDPPVPAPSSNYRKKPSKKVK